ncbi:hypothetical protein DM790_19160 [Flavobacterium collinsii]|nr:hypothetical protein [Flavobacterium collinsii]
MRTVLVFLALSNIIISIIITVRSIYTNSYFSEYYNLKSLKNKELYVNNDFLVIKRVFQDTGTGEGTSLAYTVERKILSTNLPINLRVNKLEYLKSDLVKQSIYKSKLTGDYF